MTAVFLRRIQAIVLVFGLLAVVAACRANTTNEPNDFDSRPGTPPGLNLLLARNLLVAEINETRRSAGLAEVSLDPIATSAAQAHADEMAEYGYLSHLDMSGLNPVERYSAAGGWEPAYENAWRRKGDDSLDSESIRDMHERWLKSPGHRENMMSEGHTHVGIGFQYDEKTSTMYGVEMFIDRHAYAAGLSETTLKDGDDAEYLLAFDPERIRFSEILISRRDAPQARTADWLNENTGYSLPEDYIALYIEEGASNVVLPGALKRAVLDYDREAGIVSGDITFEYGWQPGIYYIYTWGKYVDTGEEILLSIITAKRE
ncbi:hypothetical protein J7K50_04045 [bacterium]|nr:hypothetical protein [bacterium]